jgi:hypothetical protein
MPLCHSYFFSIISQETALMSQMVGVFLVFCYRRLAASLLFAFPSAACVSFCVLVYLSRFIRGQVLSILISMIFLHHEPLFGGYM